MFLNTFQFFFLITNNYSLYLQKRLNRHFYVVIVLLFSGLNFSGCQTFDFGQNEIKQTNKAFKDTDEFKHWFVFYYQNPKPEELTSALDFMEKSGLLLEFPEVASMFVSEVFKTNAKSLPLWIKNWDKSLSERQWTVVIVALWMTDQDNLKKIAIGELHRFNKLKAQKMSVNLTKIPAKILDPMYSEVRHIGQVNMLWAAFSATGDPKFIHRVVGLISGFASSPKVSQRNIGEAALVSLAQNTLIHPAVEEYVKDAEKSHPDPTTRALIQAMLQALEQINSKSEMIPQLPRR